MEEDPYYFTMAPQKASFDEEECSDSFPKLAENTCESIPVTSIPKLKGCCKKENHHHQSYASYFGKNAAKTKK